MTPIERFAMRLVRKQLRESLEQLVAVVGHADPARWSEDDFASIDAMLDDVIDKIEHHQISHGDGDVALCTYMGEAVRSLKASQGWLVRGLSADPAKRPPEDERRRAARKGVSDALRARPR